MSAPLYERVQAGEIRAGDKVARARTHPFREVSHVSHGPRSVQIYYADADDGLLTGGSFHFRTPFDRPRLTASWWRLVPPDHAGS